MEFKAYIEGITRKLWFMAIVLVLSFWLGGIVSDSQVSKYTAATTIRINSELLAQAAVPSSVVQFSTPLTYSAQAISPVMLNFIARHYPRLVGQLKNAISISADANNQLLLISVTDIHPTSAANIADYVAQQFVKTQTDSLERQLTYYNDWLQHNITTLTSEINALSTQIQTEQQKATPPISPTMSQAISIQESQAFQDEHSLYNYQEAWKALQNTRPLFANAYVIMQPAVVSHIPLVYPLPTLLVQALALTLGLFAAIVLIIIIEYFSPFVRHKGEIQRIIGLTTVTELPKLAYLRQTHLLLTPSLIHWRTKALLLLCTAIGAPAMKEKGRIVLLTSPVKKRYFAPALAAILAHNGHQTLLIDADLKHPQIQREIRPTGALNVVTNNGVHLPFIKKTTHAHLFVLPAQHEHLTSTRLIELLPELQSMFGIIIIDAPPLTYADTHLLARKATQTLLLMKKRRDHLRTLQSAYKLCQHLKLNVQGLLLT